MNTDTHTKFAAAMMKNAGINVNMKLIKNINHDIDNSPAYVMAMSQFLNRRNNLNGNNRFVKNPFDLFGLATSAAHRQHGHDLLQGMFIAMQNARALGLPASRGIMPVMAHYLADNMSNKMVAKMGPEARNIFEALYNYQTRKNMSKSIF